MIANVEKVFIFIIFLLMHTATAENNFRSTNLETYYPTNCENNGEVERNIILIQPNLKGDPFFVKCNHEYSGGGWTIVLNRFDGETTFNRNWRECVNGFGNINQEFFIGLKKLHEMTIFTLHELLFVMEDFENVTKIAKYNAFAIEDESNAYAISVLGDYSGDAGDSFTYHGGNEFSTADRDPTNCAKERSAPGWFKYCSNSNIFGKYLNGDYSNDTDASKNAVGIYWGTFGGPSYSLKRLSMLIRPASQ